MSSVDVRRVVLYIIQFIYIYISTDKGRSSAAARDKDNPLFILLCYNIPMCVYTYICLCIIYT